MVSTGKDQRLTYLTGGIYYSGMTPLAGWENFHVVVGSSADALIGLQFVVITLIANTPIAPYQAPAGDAFATPTIVHFSVVLLLADLLETLCGAIGDEATLFRLAGQLETATVRQAFLVRRRAMMQDCLTMENKLSTKGQGIVVDRITHLPVLSGGSEALGFFQHE